MNDGPITAGIWFSNRTERTNDFLKEQKHPNAQVIGSEMEGLAVSPGLTSTMVEVAMGLPLALASSVTLC
jgi:hypothetical protein